jgi:hypothetical protein
MNILLTMIACLLTLVATGDLSAEPLKITNLFNFRDNTGPNSLSLPQGDVEQVGAFVSPSGPETIVTATQGDKTFVLKHTPQPIFPDNYEIVIPFDKKYSGSWTIKATRGNEIVSAETQPIGNTPLVPLVKKLQIEDGKIPRVSWQWPDFRKFKGGGRKVVASYRIIEATTGRQVVSSWNRATGWAATEVPGDLKLGTPGRTTRIDVPIKGLEKGTLYIFRFGLNVLNEDGSTLARSATFSGVFSLK